MEKLDGSAKPNITASAPGDAPRPSESIRHVGDPPLGNSCSNTLTKMLSPSSISELDLASWRNGLGACTLWPLLRRQLGL
jgi:hypothetical protein